MNALGINHGRSGNISLRVPGEELEGVSSGLAFLRAIKLGEEPELKGGRVVVVGGGDTAMEEAIFLTKFANRVTVVHRRNALRASKIMQERAEKNPKISFVWDTVIERVFGDAKAGGVTGVSFKNVKTGKAEDFKTDGVFIAIGHEPNTKLFVGQLDLDPAGYIVTRDGTHTSVPGVFACGDVQDHVYRQAVTAAGTGCMAAIDAERYLENQ